MSRTAYIAATATAVGAAAILAHYYFRRRQNENIPSPEIALPPPANVSDEDKEKAKKHLKFGNVCARSGMPEKAVKHYKDAIVCNPLSASAHHNAASVLQRLNRFDEAIPHYESALRIKPTLIEAASNLAVAQLNAKRPADAVHSCRHAIELQASGIPGEEGRMNLEASHHLNVALRLLGRRDEAVEETWGHIEALAAKADASGADADAWLPTTPSTKEERPSVRPPQLKLAKSSSASSSSSSSMNGKAAAAALTVVCVKWGTLYGAEYVNKLSRSCRRHLGKGGVKSFVCFTEDGSGLDGDIEVRPLPSKNDAWKGWWYKAHVFSDAARLTGRILYLDLDTVIVGDMSSLRSYTGPFATLSTEGFDAEEGYVDGYNTSAMLWEAGPSSDAGRALRVLHDSLRSEVFQCLMRWDHWVEMLVPGAHTLQACFPGVFVDYRNHCREQGAPPKGSAVVCFPRTPKPHEVAAEVEWVGEHWR